MVYSIPASASTDNVVNSALSIAGNATTDIQGVLADISPDNILGNSSGAGSGRDVMDRYIGTGAGNANITNAAGAMVIDDLMQKISTKVQVAAQLLSTANNINKTVSRTLQQG